MGVLEMLPKREIAARLEETTRPLVRNLIKLYMYPDLENEVK